MTSANNILLVADNADDRDLTIVALKDSKIANEIDIAGDGEQALQYFEDQSRPLPALELLDLKLPKIMGLDVLERLRASRQPGVGRRVVLRSRRLPQLRRGDPRAYEHMFADTAPLSFVPDSTAWMRAVCAGR